MGEAVVSVNSVRKSYGKFEAIRGVSFELMPGETVGLIGPNGAGKTTIIRMISTLIRPSAGTITVCGFDVTESPIEVRRRIGVYPEVSGLYERLSVLRNLKFYASFYDVPDVDARIQGYLERFELADRSDMPVGKLSKGMKEKIVFIRTVIHDPPVVLLDEPMTGLDPDARATVKEILRWLREGGKAVMLSSHTLSDVEDICDRVIMIDKGEVLVDEGLMSLKQRFAKDTLPTLEEIYLTLRHRR